MTVKYTIYKDEKDMKDEDDIYTRSWDNFSNSVSDVYDWDNDEPLSVYKEYFNNKMVQEGMEPNHSLNGENDYVTFINEESLTMFLLRWS